MTSDELAIKSSIQIYQADKSKMKPEGFGTGCIVKYLGHTLLLSVSHVTNEDGLTTFLETNLQPEKNTTPLKPIGGLVWYDVFKVTDGMDLTDFQYLIENKAEPIDVTFAKLTEQFELKQPAMDFKYFLIEAGDKLMLDLDYATVPDKNNTYSFYGKIRPEYQGIYLKMTPTLKNGLKFHRTNGYFHMFLAPEIIKDKDDYRGCSGAPILDSEGRIVALACQIRENTKIIYGFSIQECMKLIKLTIDTNQL
ncbi:hypothetical protein Q763_16555 [Flavobacterium beibuense F44-8]|uniref:Peptidase S1 domain-containing protein n=1 Tax=Flavobacterium beibuense F44-8 TaxID=1406840 RepID=A0A0A2LHZ6_9FLAO|nr:hypothetical protein [Flavobacterium beibuense]KGO78798.1 hypothetical protein Q763_16555 [Flavobacterium beibuense F44-8]